jgi:hypothetical protein
MRTASEGFNLRMVKEVVAYETGPESETT